jgi:hypothetical protein
VQRAIVLHDFSGQNTSSAEIHQRLVGVYSDNVMSQHNIAEWGRLFADGRVSIVMMRRVAGRPVTSEKECTAACIGELICENQRVTLHHISIKLGIGYGVVHNTVYSELHYRKICACWVPRMLVDDLKACYMPSLSTAQQYMQEGNGFLDCIVTGNKTWCTTLPRRERHLLRNGNL